jgi:hypothetical protein
MHVLNSVVAVKLSFAFNVLLTFLCFILLACYNNKRETCKRVTEIIKHETSIKTEHVVRVNTSATTEQEDSKLLFIAIGSAPEYRSRREEIRRTWLRWLDPRKHTYRFFTDLPSSETIDDGDEGTVLMVHDDLVREQLQYGDLVIIPTRTGRRQYGYRGVEAMKYAHENGLFDYYMRLDDDSFPCLTAISNELEFHRPRQRFLWGKYWFRRGSREHPWIGDQKY